MPNSTESIIHWRHAGLGICALLLVACGGQDAGEPPTGSGAGEQPVEKAMDSAMEEAGDAMQQASDAMQQAGDAVESAGDAVERAASKAFKNLDHSVDEKEFRLKKSIAGLEALIEDLKGTASEQVEALKTEKKQLEQELAELTE